MWFKPFARKSHQMGTVTVPYSTLEWQASADDCHGSFIGCSLWDGSRQDARGNSLVVADMLLAPSWEALAVSHCCEGAIAADISGAYRVTLRNKDARTLA